MKYVSGLFALNLPCSLNTTGDWHRTSLPWDKVEIKDSDKSPLKDFGIEKNIYIDELNANYNVANHIRACVDILDEGRYTLVSGMRYDFFDNNEDIIPDLFNCVFSLKSQKTQKEWESISQIMEKDYMLKWIVFLQEKNNGTI